MTKYQDFMWLLEPKLDKDALPPAESQLPPPAPEEAAVAES